MRKLLTFTTIALISMTTTMKAQFYNPEQPLAHTYSIVAYDPTTGELGVAVQSHWFSVGTVVSWAEAGVGAIATQSFANPAFGPDGLALLAGGLSAQQTLDTLIARDEGRDVRQLAVVDRFGNVAAYTGSKCIPEAGHLTGTNFSVQANLMLNDKVWPAMKSAYERSEGPLEERMLAALEAGEAAGGDIRGRQSAAMLVVRGKPSGKVWIDRKTDIRIEDHAEPIAELRRIYNVKLAYDHMTEGDVAMEHNDMAKALKHYQAAFDLYPANAEIRFWTAVTRANAGQLDAALPIFREVFKADANWLEVLRRIHGTDLLAIPESDYLRITGLK